MALYHFIIIACILQLSSSSCSVCPFHDSCECTGGHDSSNVYKTVTCRDLKDVQFKGPAGGYRVTGVMLISTSLTGSTVPAGAFAPFNYIGELSFHVGRVGGGASQNTWRMNAFDGLRVDTFAMASGEGKPFLPWINIRPFMDSVRSLGQSGLRSLRVDGGMISNPRGLLADFNGLQSLKMENVKFDNFTKDLFSGAANTLTEVTLRACEFPTYVPEVFDQLKKLERLELGDNKDTIFAGTGLFSGLTNLVHLNISGRNSWAKKIDDGVFDNLPPKLTRVTINNAWMEYIPQALLQPPVTHLSFARNALYMKRLARFPRENILTYLDLSRNSIGWYDLYTFANLTAVTELIVKENNLDYADFSFFDGMDALTTLDMSGESRYPKGMLVTNMSLVPPQLSRVDLTGAEMTDIHISVKNLIERTNFELLDLTGSTVFNCTGDMKWMAKHALCAPTRILVEGAYCGYREQKTLIEHLQEIEPNPCP